MYPLCFLDESTLAHLLEVAVACSSTLTQVMISFEPVTSPYSIHFLANVIESST